MKLYYEAIKKIFDDISQGIMIVENKNQIVCLIKPGSISIV